MRGYKHISPKQLDMTIVEQVPSVTMAGVDHCLEGEPGALASTWFTVMRSVRQNTRSTCK